MSLFSIIRCFLLLCALGCLHAVAQTELPPQRTPYDSISLADLLDTEVGVASGGQQLSQREAPGITTLITSEEILNTGARDLEEALRLLVPGLDFGQDVMGTAGIIMRGVWAHEGKMLVMLDGVEMNEYTYNNVILANYFDLNMIDRIEVIRGPGSARYGGTAELGVINIITHSGGQFQQVKVAGQMFATANTLTRGDVAVNAGFKSKKGIEFMTNTHIGNGVRSDQLYDFSNGQSYNLQNSSKMEAISEYIRIAYKGLQIQAMTGIYTTQFQHFRGAFLSQAYPSGFSNHRIDARYQHQFSNTWKLTAGYCAGANESYTLRQTIVPADSVIADLEGSQAALRGHAFVYADYEKSAKFSLSTGIEHRHERVNSTLRGEPLAFWDGQNAVFLSLGSAFVQAIWKTKFATLTAGGRIDYHNIYGVAAAPRLAVTRMWDRFHLKLLGAGGYRNPAAMNLAYSSYVNNLPVLTPERAWVAEAEMGYRFTGNWYIQANVFTNLTTNTIVYIVNPTAEEYQNLGKSGSSGIEAELRYKRRNAFSTLSYSYYTTLGRNQIANFASLLNENALLGAAQHKISINSQVHLSKSLSFSHSLVWLSAKYAHQDSQALPVVGEQKLDASLLLNAALHLENIWNNRLNVSLIANNLLGQKYALVQPYRSTTTTSDLPIFYPRQEVALRVSLKVINFK